METESDRFYSKSIPVPEAGCWLWEAYQTPYGYGALTLRGKPSLAHRVSWELTHGPIPQGMVIMHKCDTPACVNPDHLALGTHNDNVQDRQRKGRTRVGCGERNGRRKLTLEQVRAIKADPRKDSAVALAYGITRHAVRYARMPGAWQSAA